MDLKKTTLIAVQGDPTNTVTGIIETAKGNQVFAQDVDVVNMNVPSCGGVCLISVQGAARDTVARNLSQMVEDGILPEYVRVTHVSVPGEDSEKIDPSVPGFSPIVSWGFGIPKMQ
jgi:hypothetical protein